MLPIQSNEGWKGIGQIASLNTYLKFELHRGFSWQNTIGEAEFAQFFPFHKPALEVLKAITFELTTARSAIHFMHQTLRYQIKNKGEHIIRLWELFDEAVRYEEDPSGVNAGLTAIKTKRETDFRAYESCKRQIEGMTSGTLKVNRDKAVKIIQTLFLYFVSKTRQQGISPEDIANNVLGVFTSWGSKMNRYDFDFGLAPVRSDAVRRSVLATPPRTRFEPKTPSRAHYERVPIRKTHPVTKKESVPPQLLNTPQCAS